jgi:DNA-binding transcriptional regulator YbjK
MPVGQATGQRREQILRATLRLLGNGGQAAVTHRAVAAEADVPLAATTYYFSSKEELLREALVLLAADEVARLRATREALGTGELAIPDVAQGIATVLAEQVGAAGLRSKFEVYLEGSRRAELRDVAQAAVGAFVDLAEQLFGPEVAPVAVAGIDGLLLHELVAGGGAIDRERLAARVELLLHRLTARG